MHFPENLVGFNVFCVNLYAEVQDSIISWQTISEEVKLILIGFLMLDTSEKGDFSCFFHRKNLFLHNN